MAAKDKDPYMNGDKMTGRGKFLLLLMVVAISVPMFWLRLERRERRREAREMRAMQSQAAQPVQLPVSTPLPVRPALAMRPEPDSLKQIRENSQRMREKLQKQEAEAAARTAGKPDTL